MSNLIAKTKTVNIDGKDYLIKFDMKSVELFQTMTGKGLAKCVNQLLQFDDATILSFLASSLRPIDNQDEPVGEELYKDFDILTLLISCADAVALIVLESMPQANGTSKKK